MEPPDATPDRHDGQDRRHNRSGSGISLQTLVIASAASAAASFAASRIWGPGTLVSAAATPVVVALVSEFLRRPVRTVAETARKVPAVPTLPPVPWLATPESADDPARSRKPADDPARSRKPTDDPVPVDDPGGSQLNAIRGWRPRWRLALGTGLVAFAIVVALYTVPDLLAGRSITGNGAPTTFFGGSAKTNAKAGPAVKSTTTTPTTTVTRTAPTKTTTTTTTTRSTTSSASTSATTRTTTQSPTTPTTATTPAPGGTPSGAGTTTTTAAP